MKKFLGVLFGSAALAVGVAGAGLYGLVKVVEMYSPETLGLFAFVGIGFYVVFRAAYFAFNLPLEIEHDREIEARRFAKNP